MKIWEFLKRHKKKSILLAIIMVLILLYIFSNGNKVNSSIQTDTVKKQDLKQTVLATGQVTSETNLSLAFKASGVVQKVSVKVGDVVKANQQLASLDNKDQLARLTQAQGSLRQAQANYQKVLSGASNEEVAAAQVALENAKKILDDTISQQEVSVNNAYSALMNVGLAAVPEPGNAGSVTATISGTYTKKEQGVYKINVYSSGVLKFQYNGLEVGNGDVSTSPQPLGKNGLYIQFSSTTVPINNAWTVNVPNTQSSSYITYYNAYQSALETQRTAITTAENAVASAQAALDLRVAQARPADVASAQAQVLSAQGQVQLAQADLENTIMRAPADGTITKVDAKVGQQATAMQALVVLQDVGNLHVEANISEANISSVKSDQMVEVTFDALGVDRKFIAKVSGVDPASTVVSGVVNYKITVSLDKLEQIKPGMTANLNIFTGEKSGVLAVPQRAIISHDNKKFVRVINDPIKKTYTEVEVTTGMEADGGLVEILTGVSEGTEVVTFISTK